MSTSSQQSLALITGASSGIGRQIAIRLASMNYKIAIDHFCDEAGANETLRLVRDAGSDGWIHAADVGSSTEVAALFDRVASDTAKLSVMVNNAAVQTFAPLLELKESDFDRTIRTNLKGTFLCTQAAGRLMKETGGSIINIGSGANRIPFPSLGDYAASKGGIEMLTKVAAIEFGKYGIRVNCIAPGAIENARTRKENPAYADTWGAITPLQRVGTESDVAGLVALLVSRDASFVTGQTWFVDGGLWTKGQWPYASE